MRIILIKMTSQEKLSSLVELSDFDNCFLTEILEDFVHVASISGFSFYFK